MRILVFGAGKCYERYKWWLEKLNIVAIIDNDKRKQGKHVDGHIVISPEKTASFTYDYIFAMGKYKKEMRNQLLELGIANDRVFNENDIACKFEEIFGEFKPRIYKPVGWSVPLFFKGKTKKILLVAHEFSNSGAPIAFFSVAKILRNFGYEVALCVYNFNGNSQWMNTYLDAGVPIIDDIRLNKISLSKIKWIKKFDLIWLNTITVWTLLKNVHKISLPIIWWLHDSNMVFDALGINDEMLNKLDLSNIKLYGVSDIAKNAFLKHYGKRVKIKSLLPGFDDLKVVKGDIDLKHKHIGIGIIGEITYIKGVDVFVEAIKLLPKDIRVECRFYIAGGGTSSDFGKKIVNESRDMPEIIVLGALSRDEVKRLYAEKLDILVCASRDDTLSIVSIEAMMFSIPVIVTKNTGVSKFVAKSKSGLVVETADAEALAGGIEKLIHNENMRKEMGIRGRKEFERSFTLERFSSNVLKIINREIKVRK